MKIIQSFLFAFFLIGLIPSLLSYASPKLKQSTRSHIYYHATLNKHLESILKNGLDPKAGGRGGASTNRFKDEARSKIFLSNSMMIAKFYGDLLACKDSVSPVILEIRLEDRQNDQLEIDSSELRSFIIREKISPSAIRIIPNLEKFICHFKSEPFHNSQERTLADILNGTQNLFFGIPNKEKLGTQSLEFLVQGNILSPYWRVAARRGCVVFKNGKPRELDSMYIGEIKIKGAFEDYSVLQSREYDDPYADFLYNDINTPILKATKKSLPKLQLIGLEKIPCLDGTGSRPPSSLNYYEFENLEL